MAGQHLHLRCETSSFEPFIYYKTIILSRQARDKHRESTPKTTTVFSGGSPAHPFNTTAGTKIGDFGASPNKLAAGKNIYLVPKGANVTLDFGAAATLTTLKVRKTQIFCAVFMLLKMIIIPPRQARDKHRESSTQNAMCFLTGCAGCGG